MELAGLASTWNCTVTGAAAAPALSSAESSALSGKPLQIPSKFAPLRPRKQSGSHGFGVFAMAGKKKVNTYDSKWSKQWFGAGIFREDTEDEEVNIIKKLEKKKVLSQVEKAGLLSKAESAGLSLSTIEKLGLLSKAEDLGLLTLAENFATSSPAALASYSLPLIVAALATIIFVPDTSTALVIGQNVVAALFLVGAGGLFVGSIVLSGLEED